MTAEDRVLRIPSATITHAELMAKQFAEVQWGINGLVPQGVSILAAKPKIGKSWFALQMCQAKASGTDLWPGRDPEAPGGALYISLEDNQRRLQKRSARSFPQRMVDGPDGKTWRAEPLSSLHFATEWPRIGDGGVRQLGRWLRDHDDTALVVIDTLQKFRAAKNRSDDYAQDYEVGSRLKELADAHDIAVLLIHHTRKMDATDTFDTVSGTLGLTGSVDASLVLTRLRGSADAALFVTGRDIEAEVETAIEFDAQECRWIGKNISVREAALDESRQQIIEVVRRSEYPLTIKQIRAGLTDDGISKSPDAVAKAVGRMVKSDQLDKVEGNRYRVAALSELSEWR